MYTCECYDYANGHLCKHVHAVHSHTTVPPTDPTSVSTSTTSTLITQAEKENGPPGMITAFVYMYKYMYVKCFSISRLQGTACRKQKAPKSARNDAYRAKYFCASIS